MKKFIMIETLDKQIVALSVDSISCLHEDCDNKEITWLTFKPETVYDTDGCYIDWLRTNESIPDLLHKIN
jgi:hypothetical protein